MKVYAVSYLIDGGDIDGWLLDFFSRKTDAIKRARELHADEEAQVFRVSKVRVPTKKAEMIGFLDSVNSGHIHGEGVPWEKTVRGSAKRVAINNDGDAPAHDRIWGVN